MNFENSFIKHVFMRIIDIKYKSIKNIFDTSNRKACLAFIKTISKYVPSKWLKNKNTYMNRYLKSRLNHYIENSFIDQFNGPCLI